MEYKRIKRLLRSEYRQLAAREKILLESPFAETTRDGQGLRQVALGLTGRSLIVAADVIDEHDSRKFWCLPAVDPSIETLELVSIYPLKFITLSVFRRKYRKVLKARLVNGRTQFYEIGGMKQRDVHWSLWCDRVRDLHERRRLGSSLSETTCSANSTLSSTIYLLPPCREHADIVSEHCAKGREREKVTVRCAGGGGDACVAPSWTSKDLYLGADYEEHRNGAYRPVPFKFSEATVQEIKNELEDFSPSRDVSKYEYNHTSSDSNVSDPHKNLRMLLNFLPVPPLEERRPSTILDFQDPPSEILGSSCDCHKATAASAVTRKKEQRLKKIGNYATKLIRKLSKFGSRSEECRKISTVLKSSNYSSDYCIRDAHKIVDSSVSLWENFRKSHSPKPQKHLRKYGLSTATYFLHALGPWSVQPGDRESVQSRRSHSCVTVRRQPADPELQLPVSRRQLAASISLTDLSSGLKASTRGRIVLFWTPDYWYRPRAATDAYREIRSHLEQLNVFRLDKESRRSRCGLLTRRSLRQRMPKSYDSHCKATYNSDSSTIDLTNSRAFHDNHQRRNRLSASTTFHLRHLLKLDFKVTLWDLDSATLARQLTLIDRELFLRIPRRELRVILKQRTSRDAPNLGAWIAFAHRISCLTASEVLSAASLDMRARLVARLLNSADKCYDFGNFQSARSIVAGLQTPAIYRLRDTWSYLKIHHFTAYETMERLSKVFKSPRTNKYRKAWSRVESRPPSMPFVGHVLAKLLGLDRISRCNIRRLRPDENRRICTGHGRNNRRRSEAIGDWLEYCQGLARSYDFPGDSLAWEFLLKARYHEDRDNFFASRVLEPPPACER